MYVHCVMRGWLDTHVNFGAQVKVAPSIATSFFTYELVKDALGAS